VKRTELPANSGVHTQLPITLSLRPNDVFIVVSFPLQLAHLNKHDFVAYGTIDLLIKYGLSCYLNIRNMYRPKRALLLSGPADFAVAIALIAARLRFLSAVGFDELVTRGDPVDTEGPVGTEGS